MFNLMVRFQLTTFHYLHGILRVVEGLLLHVLHILVVLHLGCLGVHRWAGGPVLGGPRVLWGGLRGEVSREGS